MEADILVVDDEEAIGDLVTVYLHSEGFTVHRAATAAEALALVARQPVDLALLDVMLPDMDGFALCRRLREDHLFPIVMVTARVEDLDKITGLTLGADDYVTKPFNPLELVARVKTQLRRYRQYNPGGGPPRSYDIRGLQISREDHQCTLYGEKLALTPLEFEIREKYLDSNNTVMSHIARLREKLREPSRRPKFIKTVWGVGYTIEKA